MPDEKQRVVVVGASSKPDRYSNRAVRLLVEHGHDVVPVHPAIGTIEGLPVAHKLSEIDGRVDTLTLYVSPMVSSVMQEDIIRMHPSRVLFNPGAENPPLRDALRSHGIDTEEVCTLVLLRTGQF